MVLGEHGQPDGADEDVQGHGCGAAAETERAAGDEHAEGLAGDRHGLDRDVDLGREDDEEGPGKDQHDVPHAGVHHLGHAHRHEEIGEGDASVRGGAAVESRDGDRHRRESSIRLIPEITRTGRLG